jgi:hypothetical protein
MKLYMFQVAPNPTRVRLFLAEKAAGNTEIPVEQVSVNLPKGEHRRPEYLARNPLGRLPILELDDGSCLTESLAIIEYLEEMYPKPPLMGRTTLERARVRELERIIELAYSRRLAVLFTRPTRQSVCHRIPRWQSTFAKCCRKQRNSSTGVCPTDGHLLPVISQRSRIVRLPRRYNLRALVRSTLILSGNILYAGTRRIVPVPSYSLC